MAKKRNTIKLGVVVDCPFCSHEWYIKDRSKFILDSIHENGKQEDNHYRIVLDLKCPYCGKEFKSNTFSLE